MVKKFKILGKLKWFASEPFSEIVSLKDVDKIKTEANLLEDSLCLNNIGIYIRACISYAVQQYDEETLTLYRNESCYKKICT